MINMYGGDYRFLFQKNNINLVESIEWYRNTSNDYDTVINYGFMFQKIDSKSSPSGDNYSSYNKFNIFIMNYDE